MKIKIVLIVSLVILNSLTIFCQFSSEKLFGVLPPMDIGNIEYENIKIDSSSNFDSVQNVISNIQFERKKLIYLTFSSVNEHLINTYIDRIERRSLIIGIHLIDCPIKKLPFSIRDLINIHSLRLERCDSIQSLNGFNTSQTLFSLFFENCKIKELPEGVEKLKPLLRLMLEFPDDFKDFDINNELEKFSKRKNIFNLYIKYYQLKEFPENILELTTLQTLIIFSNNNIKYPDNYDNLVNLNELRICYIVEDDFNPNTIKLRKSFINNYHYFLDYYYKNGTRYDKNPYERFKYPYLYLKGVKYLYIYKDLPPLPPIPYTSKLYIFGLNSKYKDEDCEINFKADTINKHLTLFIPTVKESDSVRIYISEHNKDTPLQTYEFNKNGTLIDLSKFKKDEYRLNLYINNKPVIFIMLYY